MKERWCPCTRAQPGCSLRASSTPCSTIPTTASCLRSSRRRTSRPWSWNSLSRLKKRAGTARSNSIIREEAMMVRERATRRTILRGVAAASALVAAPAYLRHATAATPIKIGIPTVITGGYALLGSQVIRTCKLVKKLTDAKGGLIGQPVEFVYQDTQGDPATCVRKCQELVERDNCHILTGVIVSSEAAAMFVPRFFRANTSAPMGARALALYLKDAPEKKFIAMASDAAWGRSSNA